MIKSFVYLIAIFLFFNISESISQIKFASRYLEQMYEALPSDCKDFSRDSLSLSRFTISTNNIIKSRFVTINYYLRENTIEDIGITIIDSTSRQLLQSDVLNRFVERKILELLLIRDDNSLIEKLKEEKTKILIDKYPIISRDMLHNAYAIMINKKDFKLRRDSLRYKFNWSNSNKEEVIFSFPANNTLIRAKDKKELDDEIIKEMKSFNYDSSLEEKFNIKILPTNELKTKDNIYYSNGKTFYIQEINNNSYFKMEGEKLQYIFEPDFLAESFCNLIQNPLLSIGKYIRLKHRVYGNKEVFYTVKLSDLIGYFNNSILYTGIEQRTEEGIKAVVIIHNSLLNFIHLLIFDLNKTDLFDPDKSLSASFHTNIPTDNIQNLFEDYEPQKKQFEIKIK